MTSKSVFRGLALVGGAAFVSAAGGYSAIRLWNLTPAPAESGLISAAAILVSALSAAFFAACNIATTREINRQQTTLRLILDTEEKEHYRRAKAAFFRNFPLYPPASDKHAHKLCYAHPSDGALYEEAQLVDDFLNHYELIAVGIQRKVLDESFYRDWMYLSVIETWARAAPYMRAIRRKPDDITYVAFGDLAIRWGARPL